MRKKIVLFLMIFVFIGTFVFANQKVRVTSQAANIRAKPTTDADIMERVPLGTILTVIIKRGNWFLVELPNNKEGAQITGYIHQNIIEVVEEMKQSIEPEKEMIKEEKTIAAGKKGIEEKKISENIKTKENLSIHEASSLSEKERYFMETDPYYPEWRENLKLAELEMKKTKKPIIWGGIAMGVGYVVMPVLGMVVLSKESGSDLGKTSNKLLGLGTIVGIAGSAVMAYGWIVRYGKSKKVAKVVEEGVLKGYILSMRIAPIIDPRNKTYAISFTVSF